MNFSPTKQRFSFSKEQRFKSIANPALADFTHELPSTFKRRSPSFGIGERFKKVRYNCKLKSVIRKVKLISLQTQIKYLLVLEESPDPGSYKVSSCFNFEADRAIMPKTYYYSFGMSPTRDAYNKVYNPFGKDKPEMPGPDKYNYKNKSVGEDTYKFSFRKRMINI